MSLNKFMHPRNKYRKPPDFKALAIKYPEFRKYAKQDISGKVSLDFKNLESLRALTYTLLKEDFDLDVDIPLSRLIPTLPLRLNYLLWIEDLLGSNNRTSDVKGIDIGCGASCVYPLLAAKHFRWHMVATEVDTESAFIAANNVTKNKLQDMITVRTVEEGMMLDGVLKPDTVYDFCMCNPPFFSSAEELDPQHVARSPSRPLPRNAHSGATGELVAPGGETAFIQRIVQDSVKLKRLVRIYSVMVGHKSSVSKVKQSLQEAGVTVLSTTEFCQGHTTRWGVAWTLEPAVTLAQVRDVPLSHKKKAPFSHTAEEDLAATVERLHRLMADLQITYTTLKNNQEICAMEITAMSNTWSNLRKKRRQEKLKQKTSKDIDSIKSENKQGDCNVDKEHQKSEETNAEVDGEILNTKTQKSENILISDDSVQKIDDKLITDNGQNNENTELKRKRTLVEDAECSYLNDPKRFKAENFGTELNSESIKQPFLYGSLVVRRTASGSAVELCWLHGVGGRDAAHQVLQYFKNNLKTH